MSRTLCSPQTGGIESFFLKHLFAMSGSCIAMYGTDHSKLVPPSLRRLGAGSQGSHSRADAYFGSPVLAQRVDCPMASFTFEAMKIPSLAYERPTWKAERFCGSYPVAEAPKWPGCK